MLQYNFKKCNIVKVVEDIVKNLNNSVNPFKMKIIKKGEIVPVHNEK